MAGVAEAQKRQGGRAMPPSSRGPPPPPPPRHRFEPVDREKTCPLLLRVFTKIGGHHAKEDFAARGKEPKDEVQIYTWKDATLRELTDLADGDDVGKTLVSRKYLSEGKTAREKEEKSVIVLLSLDRNADNDIEECSKVKEVAPEARRRDAKLSFAFVYPDKNGRFVVREVGRTFSYGNRRLDDAKTLNDLSFQIGDYLDVAIL